MFMEKISLSVARQYIFQCDFSKIIHKIVNQNHWLESEAHSLCRYYRNYLFLVKKYGDKDYLPPTEEVDYFWHQHIL